MGNHFKHWECTQRGGYAAVSVNYSAAEDSDLEVSVLEYALKTLTYVNLVIYRCTFLQERQKIITYLIFWQNTLWIHLWTHRFPSIVPFLCVQYLVNQIEQTLQKYFTIFFTLRFWYLCIIFLKLLSAFYFSKTSIKVFEIARIFSIGIYEHLYSSTKFNISMILLLMMTLYLYTINLKICWAT